MPNTFAYLVIFAWPVLVMLFCRNMPLRQGILISLFGGYMLLPVQAEWDLPVLPAYDKSLAALMGAFLLIAVHRPPRPGQRVAFVEPDPLPGWLPRSKLVWLCLVGLFGGILATAYVNPAPLIYGPTVLPGMTLYDGLSQSLNTVVFILPMFIARKYLADEDSQLLLLRILVISTALYGLLALYEIRMSPQLNRIFYGFFPHSWLQHIRGDGFRPLIFLEHGLRLSLLLALAMLAAMFLTRASSGDQRLRYGGLAVYLLFVLIMSKSLGALMIGLIFLPIMLLGPARLQITFAAVVVSIALTYPILRGAGLVPTEQVTAIAASISPDRAKSFGDRLNQEDQLLARAHVKPMLGWGAWGRGRIFDDRGRSISIADGYWIIILGGGGWVRYLSTFALLGLPVLMLTRRRYRLNASMTTAALLVLMSANIIDLFPNTGITVITWTMAGSLIGWLELQAARAPVERKRPAAQIGPASPAPAGAGGETPATAPPRPRSPYTPVLRDGTAWRLGGARK